MSDDHRHALTQIISETKKAYPKLPDDKFFERFAAELVLKANRIELDPDELRSGIVGGGGDGGVDGFYLFVNRRLVLEDTDLSQVAGDRLSIEVVVIQATRHAGFSESGVTKFGDFTQKCLRITANHQAAKAAYRESLLAMVQKFRNVYGDNLHKRPTLRILFYYVTQADQVDPKVESRRTDFLATLDQYFIGVYCDLVFVGAEALLKWFNKPIETTISLRLRASAYSKSPGLAYIGLVALRDFYSFIADERGELREHMFESNVRHFQGPTKVNKEIAITLAEVDRSKEFWWLNNGVTILATDVGGDMELLSVTDPLIVNGLQTSFVIHDHFSRGPQPDDERMIMIRLIKASDPALTDAIIKATNSQTYIPPAWLHATEDVHRNIETVFRGKDLFYDRRKGYHRRQGVPASKIIPLPYLAQSVVAIALRRPDEARGRPTGFVNTHYKKIFPKKGSIDVYVKCAQTMKRVEQFLDHTVSDTSDHNNLRFYVAMVAVSLILGNASPRRDSIGRMDMALMTDDVLTKANSMVQGSFTMLGGTDQIAKGPELLKVVEKDVMAECPKKTH